MSQHIREQYPVWFWQFSPLPSLWRGQCCQEQYNPQIWREPLQNIWAGCRKADKNKFQSYLNYLNIYLLENADDLQFGRSWDRFYNQAPDFHHNLYWSNQEGDKSHVMFPDKLNWDDWIGSGNDSASLWADPLFVDPSSGEYVLSESSPALEMGIQQISLRADLEELGLVS